MFSLSDDSSEDEKEEEVVPAVVPLKTTAILREREREPTYANAVVQRQMRRDEESHYANADVKNTSPWIGGGGGSR